MDPSVIEIVALYLGAFLLGSVPTSYLIGRFVKRIDIRGYGSGNVGAANVYEHIGRKWVIPVGLFDGLIKGSGTVFVTIFVLEWNGVLVIGPPLLAVAGNNWSPWLGMQGGRGLTVTAGALLAVSPLLLAISALIAIGGWAVFKSSGLWVLISLALMPLWSVLLPGWALSVDNALVLVWFSLGLLGTVSLKRLSSNWTPLPKDVPRWKVFLNRLVRDRDVDDRTEWVRRMPGAAS